MEMGTGPGHHGSLAWSVANVLSKDLSSEAHEVKLIPGLTPEKGPHRSSGPVPLGNPGLERGGDLCKVTHKSMGIGIAGFLVAPHDFNKRGHLTLAWTGPQSNKEWVVPILMGLTTQLAQDWAAR